MADTSYHCNDNTKMKKAVMLYCKGLQIFFAVIIF